jgi:type II restriction enzyme
MNLQCSIELASAYKAGSQIARVVTEDWCKREMYCPACSSQYLSQSEANTPAIDFTCPECEQSFQLKSQRTWNPRKVVDASYSTMIRAIRTDKVPHLLLLQYTKQWYVQNLMLIPRMFFSETVIEKRRALSSTARRAGWVGCNIVLSGIPEDGKIAVVSSGVPQPEQQVRGEFERIKGLAELPPAVRGWTIDVLNAIRRLGKAHFSLQDLYREEQGLQLTHPNNRNVRPKIRQQLQVLRDLRLLDFEGGGTYRLRA